MDSRYENCINSISIIDLLMPLPGKCDLYISEHEKNGVHFLSVCFNFPRNRGLFRCVESQKKFSDYDKESLCIDVIKAFISEREQIIFPNLNDDIKSGGLSLKSCSAYLELIGLTKDDTIFEDDATDRICYSYTHELSGTKYIVITTSHELGVESFETPGSLILQIDLLAKGEVEPINEVIGITINDIAQYQYIVTNTRSWRRMHLPNS